MYFVALNQEKAGPFNPEQLREMWRAGQVNAQTLFWEDGMTDWQPLESAAARLGLPAAPLPATLSPDGPPHALIAPTALAAHTGHVAARSPLMPTAAEDEVPPAAYVSLCCAVCWPLLLALHLVGLVLSLVMMVAAVVCGHSARAAIKASGGRRPGLGLATAGMVLGYLSIALGLLMALLMLGGIAMLVYVWAHGTHH